MKYFMVMLLVGGWPGLVQALTPEEAARLAVERQAVQDMFRSHWETVRFQEQGRQLWENPQLLFNGGEKITGGQRGSTFTAAIQFPVVNPLRYDARARVREGSEKLARLDNELLQRQIAYEAYYATLSLAAALEKSEHIRDRLRRMNLIRTYLQSRPFVTPRQQAERDIVTSRLVLLRNDVASLEKETAWWQNRVLFLTGVEQQVPEVSWPATYEEPDEAALVEHLARENSELVLLRAMAQLEVRRAELYRSMAIPDFAIGSYYTQELAGVPERFYGLSLNFEIPVANSGAVQAREASARRLGVESRLQLRFQELRTQLQAQAVAYRSLLSQRATLAGLTSRDLEEQLERGDRSFRQGKIDLITFLEMENTVHEAQHALIDLRLKLAEAILQLRFISGMSEPGLRLEARNP